MRGQSDIIRRGDLMKIKTLSFERKEDIPLNVQIYQKIKDDIMHGYIKKGDQLPSIRKCEELMHVSKTSVGRAYERLLDEGFIITKPKVGFFVDVDDEQARLRNVVHEGSEIVEQRNIRYDFRAQTVDVESFDIALWKKYLKSVLDLHSEIATYGDSQGEYQLRLALQKYAYSMRGVLCTTEQIIVGASFQSLLYLLCGLFGNNIVVGMTEYGFQQAETVFHDYGYPIRKFPVDKHGISMTALYESDVNLLYIHSGAYGSDHQMITRKSADALKVWATSTGAYIIEDDHNGELRYQSRPSVAMQGYDHDHRIIYIGSFSKLLLPSLRISYMVLPEQYQKKFIARKDSYAPTSSKIEQLALAHYIMDGHLERHVRRLRKRYDQKSKLLLDALKRYFPEATLWLEEIGLQVIVHFANMRNVVRCMLIANENDILIQLNADHDIALSFASIDEAEMEIAVKTLYELWKTM